MTTKLEDLKAEFKTQVIATINRKLEAGEADDLMAKGMSRSYIFNYLLNREMTNFNKAAEGVEA